MQFLKFSSLALTASLASFAVPAANETGLSASFADRNALLPGDSSFFTTIAQCEGTDGYGDDGYGDDGYGDNGLPAGSEAGSLA